MTLTIISDTVTAPGVAHTIANSGDDLIVREEGALISTGDTGITLTSISDVSIQIDGTVIAAERAIQTSGVDNLRITAGETGSISSFRSNSSSVGLALNGNDNSVVNYGQITAVELVAIFLNGDGDEVFNAGTITGTTGIQVSFGNMNASIVNFGSIHAAGNFDDSLDPFEGRGIFLDGPANSVYNGLGGQIVSSAPGGTGILGGANSSNLSVENHGAILATFGVGIDYASQFEPTASTLINSGNISGLTAYEGHSAADMIINSGTFNGDVNLNDGDDIYRGRGDGGIANGAVNGGNGNDSLVGGSRDDSLSGGADNDEIKGGQGDDAIDGGTGDDFIEGNSGDDVIFGDTGEDTISAGSGADDVRAGSNADNISGGAGDDTLRGESGADTISGGAGDDLISGSTGFDVLNGGSGDDRIFGGSSADTLEGTLGDDYLDGGTGDDLLRGGSDDDTLIGGIGQDTLSGGNGADVFVFQDAGDSQHNGTRDTITDFVSGQDMIDLSGIAAGLTFIGGAAYSGAAGEVRYNEGIGRLYINLDGVGGSDFSLDLSGDPTLVASDLIL